MIVLLRTFIAALCASALAGAAAAATVPGLRSPTGNITCVATRQALFCDIHRADYQPKLQERCLNPPGAPRGSGVDWHGWRLTPRGKASIVCTGGALVLEKPRYVTVPYGHTWRAGPYTCTSRRVGVDCRNRAGHGLFVSRESWLAW